jgi:hypothetical protein
MLRSLFQPEPAARGGLGVLSQRADGHGFNRAAFCHRPQMDRHFPWKKPQCVSLANALRWVHGA